MAFYEMQAGAEITRRQDAAKTRELEAWMDTIAKEFAILPFDYAASREAALLLAGKPKALIEDGMIAAIAKVNGLTVATRNLQHFVQFSIPLIDPFKFQGP